MEGPLSLVAMLCRTSDRDAAGAEGARVLAEELGRRRGVEPRLVGTAGEARAGSWQEDLRDSRGCLLEAGGQLDDALAAGAYPVVLASDCSICLTTLPALVRHRPDATVLWLDAHADFNTPQTSPSQFLGGMCLAGACGLWDAGLDQPRLAPASVVMCGVRDVDGGEQVLLETAGVARLGRPGALAGALAGREVFVHLDLDVLDPSILPATFAAPGGFSDAGLRTLLAEVAGSCELIGCEITSFGSPELVELVATVIDPLIPDPGSPQ